MPEPFTVMAVGFLSINCAKLIYGLGDEVKYQLKLKYNKKKNYTPCMIDIVNINHDNCSICLDEPEQCSQLKCGHIFHKKCINKWFQSSKTCPVCRRDYSMNCNY